MLHKRFGIMSSTVMKQIRILSFITATFTALALFFGIGAGHSLISARSMHGVEKEATTQCQSICPTVLNEKQKTPQVDEDDADPDPFPFLSLDTSQYVSTLYAVVISALILSFLRRRPPDLVALYANYRF